MDTKPNSGQQLNEELDEQSIEELEMSESGAPGGGKGRVEDVHGSGVYPASGPLPTGDAPYRSEPGWGQGARGPAGYQDHGDSELHIPGVIGGDDPDYTPGSAQRESDVSLLARLEAREIPVQDWTAFFEEITRIYRGDQVSVKIGFFHEDAVNTDVQTMAEGLPLDGIDADFKDTEDGTIQIMVGVNPDDHLTHTVTEPTYVWRYQDSNGKDVALEIESADGPSTLIRLLGSSAIE